MGLARRLAWKPLPHWAWFASVLLFGILGVFVFVGIHVYRQESAYFHPPRNQVAMRVEETHVPQLNEVRFPSEDGTPLAGWYVPSKNRAAIFILHGTLGDRSTSVPELRILSEVGFGVLAIDSPGHGSSSGVTRWGETERSAIRGSLSWLSTRPDLDPYRLGAIGLSMGGYILAQVAAEDERIAAVAFLGTPSDDDELTRYEYRRFGPIVQNMALLIDSFLYEPGQKTARNEVAGIASRPLLIVQGSADSVVPPSMGESLFAHARAPKEYYLVEGAGHLNYFAIAGARYAEKLTTFFGQIASPCSFRIPNADVRP